MKKIQWEVDAVSGVKEPAVGEGPLSTSGGFVLSSDDEEQEEEEEEKI